MTTASASDLCGIVVVKSLNDVIQVSTLLVGAWVDLVALPRGAIDAGFLYSLSFTQMFAFLPDCEGHVEG